MNLDRRSFMLKFFIGVIGLLLLDIFWFEKYIIRWPEYDISDRDSDRIKLIQLSDLHIEELKSFHRSIAKKINKEKPHLLLITGDSVNYPRLLPVFNDFLELIDLSIQKVVIMGNKEYDGNVNINSLKKVIKNQNGKLLINESLVFKTNNRELNIIGVDDFIRGNPDFKKAANNLNKSLDTIVLNHCPIYRDEIEKINRNLNVNIKAILSGHTHGGQITLFGLKAYKVGGSGNYLKGWYKGSESKMYVSKGIGTSYLPIRFFARAEAPIFYV